jgi:hypothetical protein
MGSQDCIGDAVVMLVLLSELSHGRYIQSGLLVHCVLPERDGQSIVILVAWSRFGTDVPCNGEVVVSS